MSPSIVTPLFAPRRRSSSSRRQRRSLGIEPLETRKVMSAAPFVTGLHLAAPPDPAAGSQDYLVEFSEAVTGLDSTDFVVATTGTVERGALHLAVHDDHAEVTVGGNPAAPTAPLTIPFGPAAAPTGVVATTTVGGVLLRWTVPHDTGGSPIAGSATRSGASTTTACRRALRRP